MSITVSQSIEDVQQILANMTAAFARGMQIPVKYVEAAVEPGSTRVRFTVSVPPPTTFQSIDVRANVLAITNEKMRAVFESAGLAELITPVGELSILVPPPPPPPSPTPLREDDDDDDDDKGTLVSCRAAARDVALLTAP